MRHLILLLSAACALFAQEQPQPLKIVTGKLANGLALVADGDGIAAGEELPVLLL